MKSTTLPVLIPLLIQVLAGCGAPQGAPEAGGAGRESSDPCHDAHLPIKRVWNEEVRASVNAQVIEWGSEIGFELAEERALEVTTSMDRATQDWALMRVAVCKDHFVRQTLSKSEYQARADCMDRLLTRQRTFLNSLSSPQAELSEQLTGIADELQSCP
jgi:hypothetical protein